MGRPKPHFKLHVSIASHRNTAVMWNNLHDRAIYCELGRLALEKYAAKTGNKFHLSSAELMAVTACSSPASAQRRWLTFLRHCRVGAASLGGHSPVTAELLGGHWRIELVNLAEKHGMSKINEPKPSPKSKERRVKREERREKSGDESPIPDLSRFKNLLKGEVPVGRSGEVWANNGEWLAAHSDRMWAAAQRDAGADEGDQVMRAFRAIMLSWWSWGKNEKAKSKTKTKLQVERDELLLELTGGLNAAN